MIKIEMKSEVKINFVIFSFLKYSRSFFWEKIFSVDILKGGLSLRLTLNSKYKTGFPFSFSVF